jgi:hypothetical protein
MVNEIKERRKKYGLEKLTMVIEEPLEDIWSYKYINKVIENREKYWSTRDDRVSAHSHITVCNKFDFVLNVMEMNPFRTSKFGWIDFLLGTEEKMKICEDYTSNKLIYVLNNITDKFHIQILNVCDKKYKLLENKKEYYDTYKYVVTGSFFTCGKEIGMKILNRLKEIFVQTTELGYGHGEEMLYLEVLDEYYDDIKRSYGDYGQTINNFIKTSKNFHYIYYLIVKNYLHYGYYKECYDCCDKVINDIETYENEFDYFSYMKILIGYYISAYYYKPDKSIKICKHIFKLYDENPYIKKEFDKCKDEYDSKLSMCNQLHP